MQKDRITIEILKYLKEHDKTDYRGTRRYIRNLIKEENSDLDGLKQKEIKKLIDDTDLLINEIILELVSKNIITPISNFEDFGKTIILVTGKNIMDELLKNLIYELNSE